jgi:hypothetical protein
MSRPAELAVPAANGQQGGQGEEFDGLQGGNPPQFQSATKVRQDVPLSQAAFRGVSIYSGDVAVNDNHSEIAQTAGIDVIP